jgi:hypothetical protein
MPLYLKTWSLLFNARMEKMYYTSTWVKLPILNTKFWTYDIFKEIGKNLGCFLDVNMNFLDTGLMVVVKVLIGLDIREGLETKMIIQKDSHIHKSIVGLSRHFV